MTATDPAADAPEGAASDEDVLRAVTARLRRLAALPRGGDPYTATAADLLTVHLLTCHGTAHPTPHEDVRVQRVIDLLHAHLDTPLTLADLAAEAGLSRYHLLRLFQQHTGQTPARFHLRLRVERGRRLLETTHASVTDIARLCGFVDPSHFAKTFRRHTGMSPSVYRSANRQGE